MKRGENKGGGLIKTTNGWGYRLTYTAADGKRHDLTRTTDSGGHLLKTKKKAKKRELLIFCNSKTHKKQKKHII